MNYKQLIKEIRATNRAVLIDIKKSERCNYSKIKFLRFFFCGDFKPLVEKFKAIGFYVMIEKNMFNEYDLRAFWITEKQEQGEDFFTAIRVKSITKSYNELIQKVKEILDYG